MIYTDNKISTATNLLIAKEFMQFFDCFIP